MLLHQRCLNYTRYLRHLMFYTCNYNMGNSIEMVLLSIFFTRSDPRRDHQQIVLVIHLSLHALALHLAVKILLLKSFCMKI